jgi:hypothetical protein
MGLIVPLRCRKAAKSPWQTLRFLAARARSTKFSADAQSMTPRGSGDRCHSLIAQRQLQWQFTRRGKS